MPDTERIGRLTVIDRSEYALSRKGFEGTDMSSQPQSEGLKKRTINDEIESKADVVGFTFDCDFFKAINSVKEEFAGKTPVERLYEIVDFHRTASDRDFFDYSNSIINALTFANETDLATHKKNKSKLDLCRKYIEDIVREAIFSRSLKKGIDPQEFAYLFISIIEGSVLLSQITNDSVYPNKSMDLLDKMVDNLW